MKHNKIFAFLLAGVLSLGIVGCGSAGSSDSSSTEQAASSASGDLKPLRLGCPGFDDYPLLENGKLAYDKGYLEEELNAAGYTLDLVTFQEAGPAINEAYASGELDMAFYGDYPAATAYSNGVDIRVIGVADKQMNAGVLAQKDAGIQSPKDLEGKKVIIGIGTNYQEYWKHLVDTYDIDESKVEIVNVVSDAASVFTTGEADAWLTLYYNVVYYENQGLGVDVENSVAHPEMASLWTVTGRNDFLQENPDAAVAVLKALQRAKEETVSNLDEFFHAIASPTLGVDVFRKAYGFDDTFAFLDSDIDSGVTDKLNYLSDFMLENGYISKAIDVDSFVDTSYYEKLKTSEQYGGTENGKFERTGKGTLSLWLPAGGDRSDPLGSRRQDISASADISHRQGEQDRENEQ